MHTRSLGLLAGIDSETLKDKFRREPGQPLFDRIQSDFRFVSEAMRRKGYRSCVGNCGSAYTTPMEMEASKDTIVGALDHAYIELKDLQGRTEIGLLREDRQGRLLHQWTVDGQPLFRK